MYKGGSFKFTFAINNNYPHEPPKVKCVPKVYHPNLDLDGNVCLNILREDWKPVLNLNAVMVGLQYLFLEPNADDPLNKGGSRRRVSVIRSLSFLADPEAVSPGVRSPFPEHGLIPLPLLVYTLPPDAANDLRQNRERFAQNVARSMRGGSVGSETFDDVRAK